MILQFLHQSLNIPDVAHSCLHFGYLVQYGNVLCNLLIHQPERHISFIIFHINDHSVQFRLIHQPDQLLHSGAAGLRTGDINAFHFRPVHHAIRSSKLLPRRRGRSRCRFICILSCFLFFCFCSALMAGFAIAFAMFSSPFYSVRWITPRSQLCPFPITQSALPCKTSHSIQT